MGRRSGLTNASKLTFAALPMLAPTKWHSWLHLAEFWYNTSTHATLGTTPFEVLYGHPPRHFGIIDPAACAVPELSEWL
jgi:hypothetical protein